MSRIRTKVVAAAAAALLVPGLVGPVGPLGTVPAGSAQAPQAVAPSPAPSPAASATQAARRKQRLKPAVRYARQATRVTNRKRANHGLSRLKVNKCLRRFARRHATRMARQGRMYHQELRPILDRCGLRGVGENVAYGYPDGRAVVNKGWMRSPGHRANILRREFRLVGIGARRGADGRWYTAQVFGS